MTTKNGQCGGCGAPVDNNKLRCAYCGSIYFNKDDITELVKAIWDEPIENIF